MSSPQHILH